VGRFSTGPFDNKGARSASNHWIAIVEPLEEQARRAKQKNAKNQSKELSILRLLKDFCLPLGDVVA